MRKIIHLDMDAFYASVEQRDDPSLRGQPVVVGWQAQRGVVCAASYEARRFGVRSAMPVARARQLCPQAIFVPPNFDRYREVSAQIGEIFRRYTALVEPLSLDEAYLDVTANRRGLATATETARAIRAEIVEATALTASAGVAPNKFLAKIASDWKKPNGLFVIQPHEIDDFLSPLAVNRLPGVGEATNRLLTEMGIATIADLRAQPLPALSARFGKFGVRLHELARGVDERPVTPDRPVQSVSSERTFERDLSLPELAPYLPTMAEQVWPNARDGERVARTVVLKLKTADFRTLTRSITPPAAPASAEALSRLALGLLEKVDLKGVRFRLLGVGVANFSADPSSLQVGLFDAAAEWTAEA